MTTIENQHGDLINLNLCKSIPSGFYLAKGKATVLLHGDKIDGVLVIARSIKAEPEYIGDKS